VNLRLFVAAELPDDVRAALAAWRPDDPALRAVDTAGVHVTLCFLGWVDEARVLTIALDDPDGRLGAVQQAVVEAMVAVAGHEPEARPFLPHVTVARVRRGQRAPRGELPAPPVLRFALRSPGLQLVPHDENKQRLGNLRNARTVGRPFKVSASGGLEQNRVAVVASVAIPAIASSQRA